MNKNDTTISVALATYNGSQFIGEQLESLARQDWLPTEVVVTDDRSSDATLECVSLFARTAPFPVRIHRNETRLGYRKNFLKAASLCSCEIVAYSDQDDRWRADKLRKVAAMFRDDPRLFLVSHNATVVDQNGAFIRPLLPPAARQPITEAMYGSPWEFSFGFTVSFRAAVMKYLPLHEKSLDPFHDGELLGHDQWVTLLASACGRKAYIDEPLVDYRQHSSNAFGVAIKDSQSIIERIHLKLEDRAPVLARLGEAACRNAEILTRVATMADTCAPESQLARMAAERWQELAELYALRARAYSASSVFSRGLALAKLQSVGAYGPNGIWSFGKKSLARDIVLGVIAGRLISLIGAPQSDRDASLRGLSAITT